MCPFLDEEDFEEEYEEASGETVREERRKFDFFGNERWKFLIIGGAGFVAILGAAFYFVYSNSEPIDLDSLTIIQADSVPIKVKPQTNAQVKHQEKVVYDNIAESKREKKKEHIIAQPEEVLSINEIDSDGVLSEEEKQKIIDAFDELAPEKEYKIKYLKGDNQENEKEQIAENSDSNIETVEEEGLPPIRKTKSSRIVGKSGKSKKNKTKLFSSANREMPVSSSKNAKIIMIQVASLPTKAMAEVEYRRIVNKNKFVKNYGKKIYKVDLGRAKGNTYRIQVGPFKNNAEAQKVISALKRNGCFAYISR